ncbi:MAG: FtsX-like permease family protein, partial [Bacteroidales bacterium]|nr:FtsX-like permease family protein [Bacteroidales bacterium]
MKQFFRNFRKQRTVGILNICGLSLGVMVSILVGLWAMNELQFDNFHKRGERMYRVVQSFEMNNKQVAAATSFKPLGEIALNQVPGIEDMCRVVKNRDGITINNVVHFGVTILVTDQNFFSFFTFPFNRGITNSVFTSPDKVVITESAAKKYFPDEDPIGQLVIYHGHHFTVAAVMADMPTNSHIQADMVFPLFGQFKSWEWDSGFYYDTYFILSEGAEVASIERQLSEINKIGMPLFLQGSENKVKLQPLKEVHFSESDAQFDSAVKGDRTMLQTFMVVALIILLIASINFSNLFVSTSFIRAKAIGIKKTHGAERRSLIGGFYKETAIYVLIAIGVGILLTMLSLPFFNSYTGSVISVNFADPQLYLFLIILASLTTIMAGSLPAFRLSGFGIIETLGGKFQGKKISLFQKLLVIIQFTASISLLIIVLFIGRQINYILSQDLGFDNKNILYVWGWRDFGDNYAELREEMIREPTIVDLAMKQFDLPTQMGNGIGAKNIENGHTILLDLSEVSPNYFDFFGMEFVAGENPLNLESAAAAKECVINERTAEVLGLKDPINATFQIVSIGGKLEENDGDIYMVKGVVRDSYVKSLHKNPDPQMYLPLSRESHNPIFVKFFGNPERAIKAIEKRWKRSITDAPFEYHFLDETYQALYDSEKSMRNVLRYALLITLVITLTGLFSMAFYATQRRMKEIGIRKVNGATVVDLLLLLYRDVIIWIAISFPLASLFSYLFLRDWLKGFILRTSLSGWIFLLAGLSAFLVA